MPAAAGRLVEVSYTPDGDTEATLIGALKSKSISFNKEPIDITTDDDLGFRAYLEDVDSLRSCDIKLSGLLKDRALLARILTQETLALTFNIPGVMQVAGDFKLTAVESAAEMEDAVGSDYSFASTGAFTIGAPT